MKNITTPKTAHILGVVLVVSLLAAEYLVAQSRPQYTHHAAAADAVVPPPPFSTVPESDLTAANALKAGEYHFNWSRKGVYDLKEAERYVALAYEKDKTLSGPPYHLGRVNFLRGNNNQAVFWFEKQLALYGEGQSHDEYFYPAHYMRALTYGFMNELELSAEGFAYLIAVNADNPRSWAYYTDLAWVYFQQGEYQKIRDIMEGNPVDGVAIEVGKGEEIKGGYERYPDNPWVLNMYGLSLLNTNDAELAYEVLLRAQATAQDVTEDEWSRAYPGNDPQIAPRGLAELMDTIDTNVRLAAESVE